MILAFSDTSVFVDPILENVSQIASEKTFLRVSVDLHQILPDFTWALWNLADRVPSKKTLHRANACFSDNECFKGELAFAFEARDSLQ